MHSGVHVNAHNIMSVSIVTLSQWGTSCTSYRQETMCMKMYMVRDSLCVYTHIYLWVNPISMDTEFKLVCSTITCNEALIMSEYGVWVGGLVKERIPWKIFLRKSYVIHYC